MSLESMEKLLISEALRRHKGNRTKVARQLGINPSTIYRKMKVRNVKDVEKDV
jgi:transcriptional regulator with PAS, ATPase and Fis domain